MYKEYTLISLGLYVLTIFECPTIAQIGLFVSHVRWYFDARV